MPKYPQIHMSCDLSTSHGNAFVLMNSVAAGLRGLHIPKKEIEEFYEQAMSADYVHLLAVCSEWVDFEYWDSTGDYS
jgi:hypothetical protein